MLKSVNIFLLAIVSVLCGRDARVARAQEARREDLTGAVSEEEFKALHERPVDQGGAPLRGEMVALGEGRAYLSLPAGAGPHPALVVVHEWWGLNDNVKRWADRLAAEGYAALAVDLYGGVVATTRDEAMAAMKAVDPEVALRRLRVGLDLLRGDPRVRAPKVGAIGWCFGGAQSLALALAEGPDLAAAVIYYGRLVTDPERLRAIRAPIIGIFGTRDPSIPEETVAAFERGLEQAGVVHEVHRFDAEHAFANPSNARAYRSASAAEAWARVRAFLALHLRP